MTYGMQFVTKVSEVGFDVGFLNCISLQLGGQINYLLFVGAQ